MKMKVKVIKPFPGIKEGRILEPGEVLTVSYERAFRMLKRGLVEIFIEKPEKPKGRPRKRKKPAEDKAARPTEDKGAEE